MYFITNNGAQSDGVFYALSVYASYIYDPNSFQVVTYMESLLPQHVVLSLVGCISVNDAYMSANDILESIFMI